MEVLLRSHSTSAQLERQRPRACKGGQAKNLVVFTSWIVQRPSSACISTEGKAVVEPNTRLSGWRAWIHMFLRSSTYVENANQILW